jgi:hypothetical protein
MTVPTYCAWGCFRKKAAVDFARSLMAPRLLACPAERPSPFSAALASYGRCDVFFQGWMRTIYSPADRTPIRRPS